MVSSSFASGSAQVSDIPSGITPEIFTYLNSLSVSETSKRHQIFNEIELQIPERTNSDRQFILFLIRISGVKKCLMLDFLQSDFSVQLEKSLPDDGKLTVLKILPAYEDVIIAHCLSKKTKLVRLDDESDLSEIRPQLFDFIYINSDEFSVLKYYKICLTKFVKSGTVICFDNALAFGKIVHSQTNEFEGSEVEDPLKIIFSDSRTDSTLIPIGNGLLLTRIK